MSKKQSAYDLRGLAAEYHVNSTLHLELGAMPFELAETGVYLFDGILIPNTIKGHNPYTEIDHLLVCSKGVFSIETKSFAGEAFGEKSGKKWFTANTRESSREVDTRTLSNPFKQNNYHIVSLSALLKEGGLGSFINNFVVLVDANEYGWENGKWNGEEDDGLFLNAEDLAKHILSMKDVLSGKRVKDIARYLQETYVRKDEYEVEFKANQKK